MATPFAIALNRGSNLFWPMALRDADGNAVDITGWTFPMVEVTPAALQSEVTCTVLDGPAGQYAIACAWSANWPDGEGRKVSIRIKPSDLPEAFPEFQVYLQ